eukprot:1157802-Pelagomonas_calceolata.AAC.1
MAVCFDLHQMSAECCVRQRQCPSLLQSLDNLCKQGLQLFLDRCAFVAVPLQLCIYRYDFAAVPLQTSPKPCQKKLCTPAQSACKRDAEGWVKRAACFLRRA